MKKNNKTDIQQTEVLEPELSNFDKFVLKNIDFLKGIVYPWPKDNRIDANFELKISWSGGGTSGNCWDDHISEFSGDLEPEFNTLDEILAEICPNITFLKYKNIYSQIVKSDSRSEGDYYGGSETIYEKSFRLYNLYNELIAKNLI